ncbi:hypothetical protein LJC20_00355 [Eubacteriales bacterium OttesenSCG-928-M02]|nr:hypothetical protein [Eubacteriales bacterium OttesenSCG-928-M02]
MANLYNNLIWPLMIAIAIVGLVVTVLYIYDNWERRKHKREVAELKREMWDLEESNNTKDGVIRTLMRENRELKKIALGAGTPKSEDEKTLHIV